MGEQETVIVASQRLEPEGLGNHLVRKPEMWNDLRKAVPGKERAGLDSTLTSGHQGQGSFHAIVYQFLKVRGHFHPEGTHW